MFCCVEEMQCHDIKTYGEEIKNYIYTCIYIAKNMIHCQEIAQSAVCTYNRRR